MALMSAYIPVDTVKQTLDVVPRGFGCRFSKVSSRFFIIHVKPSVLKRIGYGWLSDKNKSLFPIVLYDEVTYVVSDKRATHEIGRGNYQIIGRLCLQTCL